MSDFRREPLISLGTKSANNEKGKPVKRSVRISVTLPESTEDGYPEINFRQELATWEEKHISSYTEKCHNGLEPFNDEDDSDVRRVAQELEAKYGISSKKKRRKKKKDVAIGYDENDSFIDNTDCYDEIIPKNITTLHGGFYINSGALEFKPVDGASSDYSSSSSSEDEDASEKPNKKRPLSSSESEEDEKNKTDMKEKEKKMKMSNGNTNGLQKALKNKLFSDDKIKKVRKNSTEDDKRKVVRDLLKEKREDLQLSLITDNNKPTEQDGSTLANVDTVIESVISAANGPVEVIDDSSKDSIGSMENQKQNISVAMDGDSNDALYQKEEEIVKLPDNVPSEVMTLIGEIKEAAATNTQGKVKFFSGPVRPILLSLERKCRTLKKSTRVRIYEHLAPFVRCRKETLFKRAKNLILEDDQKRVKNLLQQLHAHVQNIMPNLIHHYEIESQKIIQKKFSKESLENEELKSLRMPKRRFAWTEEVKKLLKEIVSLQKKCFIMEGCNKDKLDTLMFTFLKTTVQVLWPEGWMSVNILHKYSNSESKKQSNATTSSSKNIPTVESLEMNKESMSTSFLSKTLSPITSKSSSLTITPIMPGDVQKSAEDQMAKAKAALPSDIIISNVNSNNYSVKANNNKPLPMSIEITKTVADQPQQTTSSSSTNNKKRPPPPPPPQSSQDAKDELKLIQQAMAEDLSQRSKPSVASQNKPFKDNVQTDVVPVLDLTESAELKRKPGPKSKTKYYTDDPDKPVKIKKVTSEKKEKHKTENDNFFGSIDRSRHESMTGSYALDKLISDSLADAKCFNASESFAALQKNSVECTPIMGSSSNNTISFPIKQQRHGQQEGEDNQIQEVLEGLRVLQKMSSPVKVDDFGRTSAPASVITYNSKSPPSSSSSSSSQKNETKKHVNVYPDAFQRQFIQFNMLKTSASPATAGSSSAPNSKNDFNSFSNSSHSPLQTNTKTPNNNNHLQPYHNKFFNNVNGPQQGSYNMLQDMFANLLKESGYKTAADKSNVQQK